VKLSGEALGGLVSDPVTLGVGVGLVAGKTIGVFGATAVAVKLGLGRLPAGATWRHMLGVAVCAGIGFTVALFVTSLSFADPALADSAKVGILAGSLIAGLAGYAILRGGGAPEPSAEVATEDLRRNGGVNGAGDGLDSQERVPA
jgi:Na+:H+ antiporter, NhaA family